MADAFVAACRKNQSCALKAAQRDFTATPGDTSPTGKMSNQSEKEKCFLPSAKQNLCKKTISICWGQTLADVFSTQREPNIKKTKTVIGADQ